MLTTRNDGGFEGARSTPWGTGQGLDVLLDRWRKDTQVFPNLLAEKLLPGQAAVFSDLPESLHPNVRQALEARGIRRLYSHQAEAFQLANEGRDVVVATPTASGKSLCYNLPVLHALAQAPDARALYLFPTKALSRDQEEALRAFMKEAQLPHGAITFDGDTPGDARRAARERSGVILSNPDMLHSGILPHHAQWARVFANLKYVVLDELHTYRGVFGSHLANVLRRLDRIARFHGSRPQFCFASATIGNPREHAAKMLGREVALVSQSGAPSGARRVLVYNPPVVNPELGIRQSYIKATARLAADLVRARVPTLVFGASRNNVEVLLKYLRDLLAKDLIDPQSLLAYRGGYLPQVRRDIEARLRKGDIRCVVATNALELGIDIGALDAVVCAGFPGSMAALWQRFGRAGRRQGESLALLVASSSPLDQYVAADPNYLIQAPVEQARIDPDNIEILVQHIKCAAFELPFEEGEAFREVPADNTAEALQYLARHQVLHPSTGEGKTTFHWAQDAYPATNVSLRSIGWDNVVIIEEPSQKTLAEMDWRSAHTMLHEQAIYQHDGEQYQVEKLDLPNRKAFIRKVAPDYFTEAQTYVHIEVLSEEKTEALPSVAFGQGEVSVVEKVVGFKKIKFHTHENVGFGEVMLPQMQMHTAAFWLTLPEAMVRNFDLPRAELVEALRGLGVALKAVASVGLMTDPRDLGLTLGSRSHPDRPPSSPEASSPLFDPTVFLFDHTPGGVSLSSRLYEEREALLRRARRLIEGCGCEDGCPGCIGIAVGQGKTAVRKKWALEILTCFGAPPAH